MKNFFTNLFISSCLILSFSFTSNLSAQCVAGTMITTGTLTVCEGGSFDAYSEDFDIPGGGTYAWVFRNNSTNGTGGVGSDVIIPGSVLQTLDADLGGLLSANNFPPLAGTWLVTGAVSSDQTNPGASQCSETTEFLEVTFTSDVSHNVTLSENGSDIVSTVGGGSMPYSYLWNDGSTDAIFTGAMPNDIYCLTVTDAGLCQVSSCLVFSELCEAGTMLTTGAVTVCQGGTFDLAADEEEIPVGGGYGWFISNVGTDGMGGIDAPIFLGLAETMVSYDADLNGVLSANNLPPFTGTWIITGSVYSDASDFNNTRCSNTMDSLLVTFVDTPAPTVDIFLGSPDQTSISSNVFGGMEPYNYSWSNGATTEELEGITENGMFSLTVTDANGCQQTASITVYPNCDSGTMTNTGNICVAGSNTFEVGVTGQVLPSTGGLAWFITNQNSDGTGGTGAQIFFPGADPQYTWDNDLGGLLSINMFPPLEGTWVIFAVVYGDGTNFESAATSDCSMSEDSLIVTFVAQDLAVSIADDNNTLTATASGGDGPYSYLWSTGEMSETIIATETATYSVTMTDSNGCTSVSNNLMVIISSTDHIVGLTTFGVSPNPSKGNFDLSLGLENAEEIQIQLVSLTGQFVKEIASENSSGGTYHIEGEELSAGLYLLQVTVSGQTINEKVLITN